MANTFLIERALVAQGPRTGGLPEVVVYTLASSQTFFNGAVVIISSGNAQEAGTPLTSGTTTISGLALHAAQAVYNPPNTAPANQEIPNITNLFGESQFGTALEDGDAYKMHIAHAVSGQYYELTYAGASASSDPGTSHTLAKDGTSGYWTITTTTTNPVFVIDALVQKPKMLAGTSPAISQGGAMPTFGDTNVRYLGHFLSTVVL